MSLETGWRPPTGPPGIRAEETLEDFMFYVQRRAYSVSEKSVWAAQAAGHSFRRRLCGPRHSWLGQAPLLRSHILILIISSMFSKARGISYLSVLCAEKQFLLADRWSPSCDAYLQFRRRGGALRRLPETRSLLLEIIIIRESSCRNDPKVFSISHFADARHARATDSLHCDVLQEIATALCPLEVPPSTSRWA